ncbi:MAG: Gfo/Idh/MocA family protein [bacterium]
MKKIKIGIVGLNFGKSIVNQLRDNKFFEIVAVCDFKKERANKVAEEIGVKAYYNLDNLLKNRNIPAIGLFTGPVGRAEIIEKIIDSGKDVMTTKPFARDSQKALEVLKKAQKKGRIIHMNSPAPLPGKDIATIKKWVIKYNLGQPVGCRGDIWASYREEKDGTWYDDPEKCPVAPIFRLGIYLINDLIRLIGNPKYVQVFHSSLFTERPTPDNAQLGISFKNGALANIFASFCIKDGQQYSNSLVLNYERGTIYRNIGPRSSDEIILKIKYSTEDGYQQKKLNLGHESSKYQWEIFYKAIKGESIENQITPEMIVEGIKVINAMDKAEKSGCKEKV